MLCSKFCAIFFKISRKWGQRFFKDDSYDSKNILLVYIVIYYFFYQKLIINKNKKLFFKNRKKRGKWGQKNFQTHFSYIFSKNTFPKMRTFQIAHFIPKYSILFHLRNI